MLTYVPLHDPKRLVELVRTELLHTGGSWSGEGARELGLHGRVDPDVFAKVYTRFLDPRCPQFHATQAQEFDRRRLGRRPGTYATTEQHVQRLRQQRPHDDEAELLRAAKKATRAPLLAVDLSYSTAKSISVAHAAFQARAQIFERAGAWDEAHLWQHRASQVRAAVVAGNAAMIELMLDLAGTTRSGAGGATVLPARGWVLAGFLRSWSQARDPNLYMRNIVLNRTFSSDGKWRTLDSTAIANLRAWGAAVAERVTAEQLHREAGLEFYRRADAQGFEIVGIDQGQMEVFSTRAASIDRYVAASPVLSAVADRGLARHYAACSPPIPPEPLTATVDLLSWWPGGRRGWPMQGFHPWPTPPRLS